MLGDEINDLLLKIFLPSVMFTASCYAIPWLFSLEERGRRDVRLL